MSQSSNFWLRFFVSGELTSVMTPDLCQLLSFQLPTVWSCNLHCNLSGRGKMSKSLSGNQFISTNRPKKPTQKQKTKVLRQKHLHPLWPSWEISSLRPSCWTQPLGATGKPPTGSQHSRQPRSRSERRTQFVEAAAAFETSFALSLFGETFHWSILLMFETCHIHSHSKGSKIGARDLKHSEGDCFLVNLVADWLKDVDFGAAFTISS